MSRAASFTCSGSAAGCVAVRIDSTAGKSSEAATWLHERARHARIDKQNRPVCTAGSISAQYPALSLSIADAIKRQIMVATGIDANGIVGGDSNPHQRNGMDYSDAWRKCRRKVFRFYVF
jgi:hypothetical protein